MTWPSLSQRLFFQYAEAVNMNKMWFIQKFVTKISYKNTINISIQLATAYSGNNPPSYYLVFRKNRKNKFRCQQTTLADKINRSYLQYPMVILGIA